MVHVIGFSGEWVGQGLRKIGPIVFATDGARGEGVMEHICYLSLVQIGSVQLLARGCEGGTLDGQRLHEMVPLVCQIHICIAASDKECGPAHQIVGCKQNLKLGCVLKFLESDGSHGLHVRVIREQRGWHARLIV